MKYNAFNAIVYDFIWRFLPTMRHGLLKPVADYCFPDWVAWKTETTMKDVKKQAKVIHEQWQEEENQAVVEKFQEVYPEAKVTTHDKNTSAVLIEHPPDGSTAQDLLGGAMEVKSPWSDNRG